MGETLFARVALRRDSVHQRSSSPEFHFAGVSLRHSFSSPESHFAWTLFSGIALRRDSSLALTSPKGGGLRSMMTGY